MYFPRPHRCSAAQLKLERTSPALSPLPPAPVGLLTIDVTDGWLMKNLALHSRNMSRLIILSGILWGSYWTDFLILLVKIPLSNYFFYASENCSYVLFEVSPKGHIRSYLIGTSFSNSNTIKYHFLYHSNLAREYTWGNWMSVKQDTVKPQGLMWSFSL